MRHVKGSSTLFARWQWAGLFAVLLLILLVAQFKQQPLPQVCLQADRHPCPDLLQAEIHIRYHDSKAAVTSICGDERSNACALRRARWHQAVCDIHLLKPASEALLNHELNHCRGWEHRGDSPEAYARPWELNERLVRARGRLRGH